MVGGLSVCEVGSPHDTRTYMTHTHTHTHTHRNTHWYAQSHVSFSLFLFYTDGEFIPMSNFSNVSTCARVCICVGTCVRVCIRVGTVDFQLQTPMMIYLAGHFPKISYKL